MTAVIDLSTPSPGDRYDRQKRITWWDQDTLAKASVLVVGAGALGNELIKNLTLLGVGHIAVIDLDTVEESNLARCVFFREADTDASKAAVVAERAAALNADVSIEAIHGNVMALGTGHLAGFDLILGGLDNREARAWVNQAARKLGIPWIDGAIEGLRGVARVFLPEGPCYECTLSAVDREILSRRQSCSLLTEEEVARGKVPTTATSASIIAATQVQEAVKLLHDRSDLVALKGRSFMFMGDTMETWLAEHSEDPDCLAHDEYGPLVSTTVDSDATLADLVPTELPMDQVVAFDLERDLVVSAACGRCASDRKILKAVTSLTPADVRCAGCGEMPALVARRSIGPDEDLAALPLSMFDLPLRDVVSIRTASTRLHLVLEPPC